MANIGESALESREQEPAPHWIAVDGLASIIGMSEKRMREKFPHLPDTDYKNQRGVAYVNAHALLDALKKDTPINLVRNNPYLAGTMTLKKEIKAHQRFVGGVEDIIQSNIPQPETLPLFDENQEKVEPEAVTLGPTFTERPFSEFSDEASKERREKLREIFQTIELELATTGEAFPKDFARKLGDAVSDVTSSETEAWLNFETLPEHDRRIQTYAFDTLLRSLKSEKLDEAATDAITEEILSAIADTTNPVKREYFLGLLMHYGSFERFEREHPHDDPAFTNDPETARERNIPQHLLSSSVRIKEKWANSPELTKYCDLIESGFAVPKVASAEMTPEERELEDARLISELYEGPQSLVEAELGAKDVTHGGGGGDYPLRLENPWYNIILPVGKHPSKEKLEEAERFGWDIRPVAARYMNGKFLPFVRQPLNKELSDHYNKLIRHHKDANDRDGVRMLERELREHVWSSLVEVSERDPDIKKMLAELGSSEHLIILKETIRDYPPDPEIEKVLTGKDVEM